MPPRTRYARSGELSIAYQAVGEGPHDLLFLPGWISQVEHVWESPPLRRFFDRLSGFARVILFDRRGTGLSERVTEPPTLDEELTDAVAVLDAAGSERVALFAWGLGGPTAALIAARRPERVSVLIMCAAVARTIWASDYDWALTLEERIGFIEQTVANWGDPESAPGGDHDPALVEWFARLQRLAASPGTARTMSLATNDLDVRDVLPAIRVPTLVMHRRDDGLWSIQHSRYLARAIPGARYLELEGSESFPWLGDSEPIIGEIEELITGERTGAERERALLTVMFTDIVGATDRARRVGDSRWRDTLAQHDGLVRNELVRFGGREVKTTGDGFLATFPGTPSEALRCATAIVRSTDELGAGVRIGMHTGECELIGDDVAGMAVHIASRVNALAGQGEVLVSGTVSGTVVGGPFEFSERGVHELRGVPGRWPLFSLRV